MRVNDLILAILVMVGAAALAAAASTLPPIPGQKFGADVFPTAISGGLFLCGLVLAVQSLRAGAGAAFALGWAREASTLLRACGTLATVALYMVLAPLTGFIVAATLMLLTLFLMLKVRPVVAAPVAIIATLCVYYSFAHGLRVPLPRGLIEGML
ncbi:tripartite tricarboxylate transporter TctB family protein [Xanthobacter sp. DSM 24535]|uniref:tripartite tricarboxylate transporter TctB family protein n=1 Tax=Roseixanthobacter psychrophilus TaxID=3119917 RepID=UPI003726551C